MPRRKATTPTPTPLQVSRPAGVLDIADLETDEQIEFVWMRVQDAVALQCEGNPKLHDIQKLGLSFIEYGFQDPPKWDVNLNDGKGGIIYGNGRLEALAWLEQQHQKNPELYPRPRGISVLRESGDWAVQVKIGVFSRSATQAKQFLLDHNSLTLGGEFSAEEISRLYGRNEYQAMLADIRQGLEDEGLDSSSLTLTTTLKDFQFLGGELEDGELEDAEDDLEDPDDSAERSDGSLLSLVGVTIDDPTSEAHPGDIFKLGGRHVLAVADVLTGWSIWVEYLKEGSLLTPYPGVFIPLSDRAEEVDLVMVQPDPYMAGHILDRYKAVHGEDSVVLITAGSGEGA